MFKYQESHPYRPLNWRWERARLRKEYGRLTPGLQKDDKWTRAATSFRIAKDACVDELQLYQLFDKYPDLAMAYELWDEENVTSTGRANPMRYEIEARLLARETKAQIAQKAGTNEAAIGWYEKLFFNVEDRINNRMYILHMAVGDAIQRGLTDRDYAVLWKLYAYVRGSVMLDFLITTFNDWSQPGQDQIESALLDDHKLTMRRKAALSSRMMGINHHSADRLIELHTKIIEIEKAAGTAGGTDALHNNIHVMITQLPLLVGKQATDTFMPTGKMSADLRAGELLALSAGQTIDVTALAEYKFPEKPNHG